MPLLLETIKIEEGEIFNLFYHQKRCDESRKRLFKSKHQLKLSSIINPPPKGLYKCRIVYAQKLHSIEYIPYRPKAIHSLKIVSSSLSYDFKYANRVLFDTLLATAPNCDDIIIEKNGYLTDTSIANIAFYDGSCWFTPANPLLKGTMRQKLLDEGFLKEKLITRSDLKDYKQVALINAMLGFRVLIDIVPKEIKGTK